MGRESSEECLVFFYYTKEGFSLQNYSSRYWKFSLLWSTWTVLKRIQAAKFLKNHRYILYSTVKKITFLIKRKFIFTVNISWTFYTFWDRLELADMRFMFNFAIIVPSRFCLRERIPEPVSVTRIALRINLWVFI